MKKLLLGICMMLISQMTVFASKDVTITVSSDGATKEEAIAKALRSAIEQTYGAFVSTNTTILNDKLVDDEIVSLSRGNIKKYKILSEEAISPNKYYVVLSAVVNMEKLVTYVHGSSNEVEVDLEAFDANVRMAEMNSKAERKIIESVIAQIQSMENLWDYSIQMNEPKVKGDNYEISGVVSVKYNKNTCNAINLLVNMLNSINLSKNEAEKLGSIYGPRYQVPIIGIPYYDSNHQGGTTNHWPITYIFPFKDEIRLRNTYKNEFIDGEYISPVLLASKIKFVVEPFDETFSGNAVNKWSQPRKAAGHKVGSSYYVVVNGQEPGYRKKDGLLMYGNYKDLHGYGVREVKHKVGDVVVEIDVSFIVPKNKVANVKKITVRGL